MTDFNKYANAVFPVSALYIQLDTNTGPKGESNVQLFKSSMLKMPKTGTPPVLTSEFPFFTKYVRYPSSIERKPWKTRYEFFFNRAIFMDLLRKEIVKTPDIYKERLIDKNNKNESDKLYEWMQETEKHNIMVTLRSIFPIPETFGNALKNSHDHVLKNIGNGRVITDISIRNSLNIFGFMYKFGIANKEREDYFINIGGKQYEVEDVVWENDVVNHPVYREFLKSQRAAYEDVEKSADDVQEKLENYSAKIKRDLETIQFNSKIQREFYLYTKNNCGNDVAKLSCYKDGKVSYEYENDMYKFLTTEIKPKKDVANIESVKKLLTRDTNDNYSFAAKYFIHTFVFKKYYDDIHSTDLDNIEQELKTTYDKIEKDLKTHINAGGLDSNTDDGLWAAEFRACHYLHDAENDKETSTPEEFDKYIESKILEYLKADTIIGLKQHIIAKNLTRQTIRQYASNVTADRSATVNSIETKLLRLIDELDETAATDIMISIKEDFDNHLQMHRNENVSVFMDKEYELLFERLLKSAIEIRASTIVFRFAKENVPMNLTDKTPNGTDISPIMKRINKFIRDFYSTEASINNQLSTNVSNVFEPIRKSSNRDLYRVLQLFKYGNSVMKTEYKMDDKERTKSQTVLDDIHNEYISISYEKRGNYSRNANTDLDKYLYTGIDEVKSIAKGDDKDKNTKQSNPEINRTVQEIYVRMNLVDSATFETVGRASCKLFDKELEQEFKYLADPRNENYKSLSRFRDLDFAKNAAKIVDSEALPKNKTPKKQKNPNNVSRRANK